MEGVRRVKGRISAHCGTTTVVCHCLPELENKSAAPDRFNRVY
jgi:hypothetical protein